MPDRIAAAVEALPLTPTSAVLEIGGGAGAAAQLVLARLGAAGSYVSVDRSELAQRRTRQRCADVGSAARWEVVRGAIEDVVPEVDEGTYDVVFAVNVNVFWTTDASALSAQLRRVLRRGGSLWLFYETPSGTLGQKAADGVTRSLTGGGFATVSRLTPSPRLSGFTASD